MTRRGFVVVPGRMLARAVLCASVVLGLAACNSPIEVPPGATAAPPASAAPAASATPAAPAAPDSPATPDAPANAPASATPGAPAADDPATAPSTSPGQDHAEFVARCLSDAGTPFRPSAADGHLDGADDDPDPVTDPDLLVDPDLLADQAAFDANQARCEADWFGR